MQNSKTSVNLSFLYNFLERFGLCCLLKDIRRAFKKNYLCRDAQTYLVCQVADAHTSQIWVTCTICSQGTWYVDPASCQEVASFLLFFSCQVWLCISAECCQKRFSSRAEEAEFLFRELISATVLNFKFWYISFLDKWMLNVSVWCGYIDLTWLFSVPFGLGTF